MSKILDDGGVEFSGGESQRIELCRVLYKNSLLVILDEPTASLDPQNEYELYKQIRQGYVPCKNIRIRESFPAVMHRAKVQAAFPQFFRI